MFWLQKSPEKLWNVDDVRARWNAGLKLGQSLAPVPQHHTDSARPELEDLLEVTPPTSTFSPRRFNPMTPFHAASTPLPPAFSPPLGPGYSTVARSSPSPVGPLQGALKQPRLLHPHPAEKLAPESAPSVPVGTTSAEHRELAKIVLRSEGNIPIEQPAPLSQQRSRIVCRRLRRHAD